MANNNLEKYLEAILDKIADGTETDVPRPSWNIEKYLAAIYEALSSGGGGGGGSGGGVLVVRSTVTGSGDNEVHTLDKTWKEIADAGYAVVCERQTNNGVSADLYGIITAIINMDPYTISVFFRAVGQAGTTLYYQTDAEDGYPFTETIS